VTGPQEAGGLLDVEMHDLTRLRRWRRPAAVERASCGSAAISAAVSRQARGTAAAS
jgi:hypothetical protein